jgi:hypothetical protein
VPQVPLFDPDRDPVTLPRVNDLVMRTRPPLGIAIITAPMRRSRNDLRQVEVMVTSGARPEFPRFEPDVRRRPGWYQVLTKPKGPIKFFSVLSNVVTYEMMTIEQTRIA